MPSIPDKLKALARPLTQPSWLCFAWFGLTAGVSLLAVPVNFTAPLQTRVIALDVARVLFEALNRVELVLLILLLVLVRISGGARELWAYCAILTLLMIAQSAWLLPELSARAIMIAGGTEPGPSIAHGAYAATELVKLATLFLLGLRRPPGRAPTLDAP